MLRSQLYCTVYICLMLDSNFVGEINADCQICHMAIGHALSRRVARVNLDSVRGSAKFVLELCPLLRQIKTSGNPVSADY